MSDTWKHSRASIRRLRELLRDADEDTRWDFGFWLTGFSWFRPGAHGYTGDLADAGMFRGDDAKGYLSAEGVFLVPLKSMKADLSSALELAEARTKRLRGMMPA